MGGLAKNILGEAGLGDLMWERYGARELLMMMFALRSMAVMVSRAYGTRRWHEGKDDGHCVPGLKVKTDVYRKSVPNLTLSSMSLFRCFRLS